MKYFEPRATDRADRLDATLVLAVLFVDIVLLAMVEIMFSTLSAGATPLPLSALVALVTTPLLVRRAGELSTGTFGAVLIFFGWVAVITGLGLGGPGGDVLLPGALPTYWSTYALIFAGLVPGGFALGRVIRHRRNLDRAV